MLFQNTVLFAAQRRGVNFLMSPMERLSCDCVYE